MIRRFATDVDPNERNHMKTIKIEGEAMRKFSVSAFTALFGAFAMLTVSATSAHAVDFVADSIEGLKSSNVVVDSSAALSKSGSISETFEDSGIGVVVLPEMADDTFSATHLAGQILNGSKSDYSTIIVVIDSNYDTFGVASNDDPTEMTTALNVIHKGDAGETISAASRALLSEAKTESVGTDEGLSAGAATLGAGFGIASLIVVAIIIQRVVRKAKSRAPKIEKINLQNLPQDLKRVTEELVAVHAKHMKRGHDELSQKIGQIIKNLEELFKRMNRKGTDQQKRLAAAQYVDTLGKLNSALGDDYYLDIEEHPELWNRASDRIKEIEQAVDATHVEIISNIRNFNESRDLEFKVALESLTKSLDENSIGDLYGKGEK